MNKREKKEEAMKKKAEKIREELIAFVKKSDLKGVQEFIFQHKDEISQIYEQYGSGCDYLYKPYAIGCDLNPKFATEYQICLETEIGDDVLFLDE